MSSRARVIANGPQVVRFAWGQEPAAAEGAVAPAFEEPPAGARQHQLALLERDAFAKGFEQGERSITRRFGGLGLGLAISKAIAEMHGGSLAAASEGRGRGSTFTLRLPDG